MLLYLRPYDEMDTEQVNVVKLKVHTGREEDPLVDLALNHPETHIRVAAVKHIENPEVLTDILQNDEDNEVKKTCLDRLGELFID